MKCIGKFKPKKSHCPILPILLQVYYYYYFPIIIYTYHFIFDLRKLVNYRGVAQFGSAHRSGR